MFSARQPGLWLSYRDVEMISAESDSSCGRASVKAADEPTASLVERDGGEARSEGRDRRDDPYRSEREYMLQRGPVHRERERHDRCTGDPVQRNVLHAQHAPERRGGGSVGEHQADVAADERDES